MNQVVKDFFGSAASRIPVPEPTFVPPKINDTKEEVYKSASDVDRELMSKMADFYADFHGFVMYVFDWGHGELIGQVGPDTWQKEVMDKISQGVRERNFDGVHAVDPLLLAVASGHGIGKSALSAWLVLWVMSTRPYSKGVITANTGDQLRTKTMSELSKWRSLCITGHWFEMGTMSMYHKHPKAAERWRVDAQTCREENSESFAGLHSASSTPWYLFDEASAIPEKIWEVAKGGLTDGEPMHFAFGNPTKNNGSFRECFGRQRHRWMTMQVDSRTAKMTNKKLIQEWIDDYGEDSDFVRVRVRGMFPKAGDAQFMPSDVVFNAMKRDGGRYIGDDPLICGFDVARGGDDNCVIQFRRGQDAKSDDVFIIPGEVSRDSTRVITIACQKFDEYKPDVICLDCTGIGGPIGDRLRQIGWNVIDVGFGHDADDKKKFHNKAAEMYWRLLQWMKNGGAIMDDPQLEMELTNRNYDHDDKDRLRLEKKSDVKKRASGASPDRADALALTFAIIVPKREHNRGRLDSVAGLRDTSGSDRHPLDAMDIID